MVRELQSLGLPRPDYCAALALHRLQDALLVGDYDGWKEHGRQYARAEVLESYGWGALSPQERQVMEAIVRDGLTSRQAGKRLGITYDAAVQARRGAIEKLVDAQRDDPAMRALLPHRPKAAGVFRRVPIPAALRREVYQRDGQRCVWCGATEGLTIDHIQPVYSGGVTELRNLQTLCKRCNSRKGRRMT